MARRNSGVQIFGPPSPVVHYRLNHHIVHDGFRLFRVRLKNRLRIESSNPVLLPRAGERIPLSR